MRNGAVHIAYYTGLYATPLHNYVGGTGNGEGQSGVNSGTQTEAICFFGYDRLLIDLVQLFRLTFMSKSNDVSLQRHSH